jgi:hypothetical protein
MRRMLSIQPIARIVRKLGWVLAVSLYPPASLVVTATGCAGSQCTMTCSETNVCLTAGCFHDKKDHCEIYPPETGWNTQWDSGSEVRCDKLLNASGTAIAVTCKGISGAITGDSCTCNFVYTNGVMKCG